MDTPTILLWLLLAVFAPVAAGAATLFLPRPAITARTLTTAGGLALSFAALLVLTLSGDAARGVAGVSFVPSVNLDLTFHADALGLFFGLLISGVGTLIALYARAYFGPDEADLFRFYPTLGLFASAMLGLVLSDHLLAMLLFWEATSISSFLLIGWERQNKRAVRLAVQALATTGLGGLALLGGLILLAQASGAWTFTGVVEAFQGAEPLARPAFVPWAFALIFLGAATKSAQWPFHYWLPGAMAAPTPVSAYLHAATMVKAGIYLFARLFPAMQGFDAWAPTLLLFGAVTMTLGAYLALRSDELKRIFAYTTVSQLGLFTCMYGLGAVSAGGEHNLLWPIGQIANHAMYKAPLFLIAGAIMHRVGRAQLSDLTGLVRRDPLMVWICLIALYALAGGPFTFSFTAKEAFFEQIVHAASSSAWIWLIGVAAVATAMFNVAIFVRFLTTFLSRATSSDHAQAAHHAHEHEGGFWGAWLWWPAALLAGAQLLFGLAPNLAANLIHPVETHLGGWAHWPGTLHAFTHPGAALAMSGLAIALGVALGLAPILRRAIVDPHDRLYPACSVWLQRAGARVHAMIQTGNFRHYVYAVLTALLLGLVAAAITDPSWLAWPGVESMWGAETGLIVAALCMTALICATAVVLPLVSSRIVRVLTLGACGLSVTGMYLLYQAPDLALTQLMFEIVSVILFLLVLRMLPEESLPVRAPRIAGRAAFSIVLGVAVGWIVLQAGAVADARPGAGKLGQWFLAHAVEGSEQTAGRTAGGANAVNVVLVDFRGFDTLGEITVLAIAAMGVFALIAAVPNHASQAAEPADSAAAPTRREMTSPLFRTSMRLILPLSLIFAAYMFFKGHNEPGGGFIAGLVASVALAVYRMAEGPTALKRLLPIKPGLMAATGLGIALLTAVAPMLFGRPFLTSHLAHITLANHADLHISSSLFFDLGVLIVVVAASVGMINRLTEELET